MSEEVKLLEAPKFRCEFLFLTVDEKEGEFRRCGASAKPRFWTNFMTGEQEVRNLCDTHFEMNCLIIEGVREAEMMIGAGIDEDVAIRTFMNKLQPFAKKYF
jgi:hypothetical protein